MRSQPIQDDIRRSLKDHIRHEEDGQGDVKLVALELEVFLQPLDSKIANVTLRTPADSLSERYRSDDDSLWLTDPGRPSDTTNRA